MRKLKLKEIFHIVETVREMRDFKLEHMFMSWDAFWMLEGLYFIKLELLAIWKLGMEHGISLTFSSLPEIIFDDGELDIIYDMESEMFDFIYPSQETMLNNNWVTRVIKEDDIDTEELDFDEDDCEELKQRIIAEYGDVSVKLKGLIEFWKVVANKGFYPYMPLLIKSERVGKYLEYAKSHPNIRRSKQHKAISDCIDAAKAPLEYVYENLECEWLENGCFYAFSSGGSFEDSEGECISTIHGKVYRSLFVEILNQLLSRAEKKYGYMN